MTFGVLCCNLMIGAIVYFVGMCSGIAMSEKTNEMTIEEIQEKATERRNLRKIKFQEHHLGEEA